MTDLLQGIPGTKVIMDDILIYGKSIEEHDSHLDGVLDTVQRSGLKLNKAKCELRKEELGFFGHRVGKDGITVNFLGPFWPQKWGQIFDPETAPYGGAILAPYGGAILAPYGGAILAPKTGPNF